MEARPVALSSGQKGIEIEHLYAWYGSHLALKDISLAIPPCQVMAVMGPSGCGKSTLIRCVNRMHEVVPGARVGGKVYIDGEDIYAPGVDPTYVRRRVGMVFQKPNPFPTMSILDNVVAGLKLLGQGKARQHYQIAEQSLRQAALWQEVHDRLHHNAATLSGGQQQRLCIARALAVEPEALLLDEPCSALDPVATLKIEDLMRQLSERYTIILVTHNMQQAARVSDVTAFLMADPDRAGELVEQGPTKDLFTNPKDKRTEDYITGRFG